MPTKMEAVLRSHKWEELKDLAYLEEGDHPVEYAAPLPPTDHNTKYYIMTVWGERAEAWSFNLRGIRLWKVDLATTRQNSRLVRHQAKWLESGHVVAFEVID